tara:strand:- start:33815 stop:35161 length:1347 start_codon:yes stop_codon:yes gene_type:complete
MQDQFLLRFPNPSKLSTLVFDYFFKMRTIQKQHLPALATLFVLVFILFFRFQYWSNNESNGYNATSWDAFGYYMYLPATFIYGDVKKLDWVKDVDKTYNVTGGEFYQVRKVENKDSYAGKYLTGVACMQLPYFIIGHLYAKSSHYKEDGFSAPYQYAILFGAILHVLIGLILLSKVLRRYFSDQVVALTIVFIGLTTNLIQYTSIDGAMSHSFIFPLYSLLLYFTIKWHEIPRLKYAIAIGAIIGLATISRPTEFIMIFIPIFWNTTNKEERTKKWELVLKNRKHILFAMLFGIIAMLPQFIYWKYATGSLIYNVGSKWYFLNPWFRVLFGPEKGWFLYTPVAVLMFAGFFLMRSKPYQRSILIFLVLNIWIIISWSDWTYGASYSTRAFVQSYPVFAFPLAATITYLLKNKLSAIFTLLLLIGLTVLNFYQMHIYNLGILTGFSPLI